MLERSFKMSRSHPQVLRCSLERFKVLKKHNYAELSSCHSSTVQAMKHGLKPYHHTPTRNSHSARASPYL